MWLPTRATLDDLDTRWATMSYQTPRGRPWLRPERLFQEVPRPEDRRTQVTGDSLPRPKCCQILAGIAGLRLRSAVKHSWNRRHGPICWN